MSNDKKNNEDRPIWLTSLAEADRDSIPPMATEERLQGALRHRRRSIWFRRAGTMSAAAVLTLALWQTSRMGSITSTELFDENVADAITEAMNVAGDDGSDFVPTKLASEQPLESVRVVRVSLPSGALASYGVPSSVSATGGEVTADLLVGQDGIARAIRVVR